MIPFYSRNKIKDLINIHTGRKKDITCDDELIALSMITMNQGVSIIPEYRVPKHLHEELTIRNIEENEPFKYGLIINPDNNYPYIDDFIDSFKKVINSYKFNDDIL